MKRKLLRWSETPPGWVCPHKLDPVKFALDFEHTRVMRKLQRGRVVQCFCGERAVEVRLLDGGRAGRRLNRDPWVQAPRARRWDG